MAAAAGLYFVGTAIAGAIKRKREGVEGIGRISDYDILDYVVGAYDFLIELGEQITGEEFARRISRYYDVSDPRTRACVEAAERIPMLKKDWRGTHWKAPRDLSIEGIGKLKRRIYSEMSELQKAGVPLNVKWSDLDTDEQKRAEKIAHNSGYVQPKSSTKTYGEAFYNSLHRAYNAIAGTDLPYQESVVENEYGDPIIIYRDYGTDEAKQRRALSWYEDSIRPSGDYDDAYRAALLYLAEGGKLIWSKEPGGVQQECFATATNASGERKARISYLASEAKGGKSILQLAHSIFEHFGIDDMTARDAICDVVRNFESTAAARKYIYDMYIDAHTQQYDPGEDVPF